MYSKKWLLLLAVLALSAQSFEAAARVGASRSGSSYSRPAIQSMPSRSVDSQSSRLGNGANAGMQRPDVMNNVRANSNTSNAGAGTSNYNAPIQTQQAQAQKPGFGVGSMVGAAAAGAAVGYLANSAMHPNQQAMMNNNGSANGITGSFDDGRSAAGSGSNGGGMLTFALFAVLAGLAFWLYRRTKSLSQETPMAKSFPMKDVTPLPASTMNYAQSSEYDAIEKAALKFFTDMQEANNRGDTDFIAQHATPSMQEALLDDIRKRDQASDTKVVAMKSKLVDLQDQYATNRLLSVRFTGMVREAADALPENVDEVWHFAIGTDVQGPWQLAGIEQV